MGVALWCILVGALAHHRIYIYIYKCHGWATLVVLQGISCKVNPLRSSREPREEPGGKPAWSEKGHGDETSHQAVRKMNFEIIRQGRLGVCWAIWG